MPETIIHLAAPASPGRAVLEALELPDAGALIDRAQEAVGPRYRVRGRQAIIEAEVDDSKGGRTDDAARIREIAQVLGDDRVVAMVAVRGGGWLTRILPHIDWKRLDRRTRPLAVFGFSELTPLINIVGGHRFGLGCYYMTPGFPRSAMARYARLNPGEAFPGLKLSEKALAKRSEDWAAERLPGEFEAYFRDVVRIVEGEGPSRPLTGRLVHGRLAAESEARFVGGCLSLVTPMTATVTLPKVSPKGRWIVLEDLEEAGYRIDRQFAHIKLAGWFEQCAGVLLGDFHSGDRDQSEDALAILKRQLPKRRNVPVIHSPLIGHTWPQAVLPLRKRVVLRRGKDGTITFDPAWRKLGFVRT